MNADSANMQPERRRSARGIRILLAVFIIACLGAIAWMVPRVLEATFEMEVGDRIDKLQEPAPMAVPGDEPIDLPADDESTSAQDAGEATLDETLVELLRLPPLEPSPQPPPPAE